MDAPYPLQSARIGIKNVFFISMNEANRPFKNGNSELEKKLGKNADVLVFSRVGFSSDKTLALIHVSGGAEERSVFMSV